MPEDVLIDDVVVLRHQLRIANKRAARATAALVWVISLRNVGEVSVTVERGCRQALEDMNRASEEDAIVCVL